MTLSIWALITTEGATKLFDRALDVMRAVGLDVDSWRDGDPTLATAQYQAEVLAERDAVDVELVKAGFLSLAEGDWLTIVAREMYGVERIAATPATPTVTITNSGGGHFVLVAGDLVAKSSVSGKTYTSTSGGTLSAGATVTFDLACDEDGSDGSVAVDDIDSIVAPTLLGCAIDSSTASVGVDGQGDASLREQCESTLGALSPNGPADAYEYVSRNPDLTGVTDITRARSIGDNANLDVTIYVAGTAGAVAGASVTAAQDAIEEWATPLCVTPTVVNATGVATPLTVTIEGDPAPGYEDAIESAYAAYLSVFPISDGTEFLARSSLTALVHATDDGITRVTIDTPATDPTFAVGEVPIAGAVSVTLEVP